MKKWLMLVVILGLTAFILVNLGKLFEAAVVAMGRCLDENTKLINTDISITHTSTLSQEELCKRSKEQTLALQTCYKSVSEQTFIPTFLAEIYLVKINARFPKVSDKISSHNRICAETMITL